MRQFLVFKCPKCTNFTNAPVGQQRRRCSYCGNIIDIKKASAALFDSPEMASAAVKAFNASRGGDEFEKAVERSRERVKKLIPGEQLRAEDIIVDGERPPPEGKRKILMSLLQKAASDKPCTLGSFEEMCLSSGLDWAWTEDQLESLANTGVIIFPRPWSIQLVGFEERGEGTRNTTRDISLDILKLLDGNEGGLSVRAIVEHFEKLGLPNESVHSSLERLMQKGSIYEPKHGEVRRL